MASSKRCHYEVLGLSRDCTAEEIRSAYKKLALQLHPDKLIQSGLSHSEATSKFQELSHAYEVLSDPKERAWYDSHRSQILFSDPNGARDSVVPDLFSFFSNSVYSGYGDSGNGFYKIYAEVFNRIYANEANFIRKMGLGIDKLRDAPIMGNLDSPYEQVTAFYSYWLGFATVMDFCWVDMYDASVGVNRKSRRVMEEENNKLRKKARREYNETVRGLTEFVKKRDKRVIDMMIKRNKEMEKRKEEEKERKKMLERERIERARNYKDQEWAKNEDPSDDSEDLDLEDDKSSNKMEELYCIVCRKKFKSDKQWKNHEQSKKHKERVSILRHSFKVEDEEHDGDLDEQDEQSNAEIRYPDEEDVELRLEESLNLNMQENEQDDGYEDADVENASDEKGVSETDNDEASISNIPTNKNESTLLEEVKESPLEADDVQNDNRKRSKRRNVKEKLRSTNIEQIPSGDSEGLEDKKAYKKSLITKSSSKGKKGKGNSMKPSNSCDTCGEEFNSKNKLHKHLADSGHATLKHR